MSKSHEQLDLSEWVGVFWAKILCDAIAAVPAIVWLKPLARRTLRRTEEMAVGKAATPESRAA